MSFQVNILLLVVVALGTAQARAQKFYSDDPLLEDNDKLDTPEMPEEIHLSDLYDRLSHTLEDKGSPEYEEAQSVNTLDEVPDSSWFTNRHGSRRMSLEELVRGPNQGAGPDPREPWTVVEGKTEGLTPGFEIVASRGDRYLIKLDPVDIPELSSAAEVIATKLFYAFGYHVPENYIVRVDPDRLVIAPGARVEDRFGDEVPLTTGRLERMLGRVPRLADGTIRVLASKYIPGRPLGPFRYYGTRSDDPNDIIPHEHRRELRGLRLFAAWLNHDDTRAQNTQDTWVEENGRHYVRHYLIDFGSTFGSGSVDLQLPQLGFHYWLDMDLVKKNALGFGLHVPKYRKVKWPEFPKYRSVGRWESEAFDPEEWKSEYPNPAFVRMTPRDAFWAARIIMRFTPEELLAIVKTGEYSDPEQEAYFYETLLERQRKVGRFGLNAVNPVGEVHVSGGRLEFSNLSEEYGLATTGILYEVTWSVYDNRNDTSERLVGPSRQAATSVPLPVGGGDLKRPNEFLTAEIRALHENHPEWNQPVAVYLRPNGTGFEIAGIER